MFFYIERVYVIKNLQIIREVYNDVLKGKNMA